MFILFHKQLIVLTQVRLCLSLGAVAIAELFDKY